MSTGGDHPSHAPHERRRAGGGDPRAGGARRGVGATVLARPGLSWRRWP